jgi:hypothetical protein
LFASFPGEEKEIKGDRFSIRMVRVGEHQGNQITEKVKIIIFFLLPQLRFETENKRSYSCQKRVVHGRCSGQPREKIE